MTKGIFVALGGLVLLAGCGSQGNKAADAQLQPKWKGAPYRIAFDTKAAKPPAAGIAIPSVKFTANPEELETRAVLVVRFDATGTGNKGQISNHMIAPAVDIHGAEGTLPADYMESASKGLSNYLAAYCLQGNVKVSVALARSSLNPQAQDSEIDDKRLSDWIPVDLPYKNPHSKC